MRIIFLTNLFEPVGSNCLKLLLDNSKDMVGVFVYNYKAENPLKLIKDLAAKKGRGYIFRKTRELLFYKARITLRKMGFPLRRVYCFPELLASYKIKNLHYINDVNALSFAEKLRELKPDLIVVSIFSQILKKDIINIPTMGCINIHPSLLPKYRGPNPYFWVLRNKEKETGVTIHYIDEGIDSGNIIASRAIPITTADTEYSLRSKTAKIAPDCLLEVIQMFEEGRVSSLPQDNSAATYFSEPPKEMGAK